tara:strand:- start:360 stop:2534 length:2175 start_codon:yes stop_codon:yes gene_type:complete
MSDAEVLGSKPESAEAKFVQLEQELVQETSVIALMKDQMTSMFGMVFMFIITIVLALYIRPWYDVAELHAFGEAGATQVRFIFLELVMIFIFTAVVIALARYKKEWIIKYGIMGVLTIALMYTTVPLMHMLVIDFEVEEFDYQESFSYGGDYVSDLGMDGFLTHELIGNFTNWEDSLSYYSPSSLSTKQAQWTTNFSRLPAGDFEVMRVVESENYLTLTNTAWIWTINSQSGAIENVFPCHYQDDQGVLQTGMPNGYSCDLAVMALDGVFIFSKTGEVYYHVISPNTGALLPPQAHWVLPSYISYGSGFIEATQISEDRLLLVTDKTAMVMVLKETKESLTNELMPIEFEYFTEETLTAADFGHSPWSDTNISENLGSAGFLIVGEANGNVTGWEWDGTKTVTNQFTLQEKMNVAGLVDSVVQVQITDLDDSGYTDLLISGTAESYWLHTQLLKNRISFSVGEEFVHGIFVSTDSVDSFYAVSSTDVSSGIITDDMYTLDGLQLYDIPFFVGVFIALLLMVLLYVHSEWYVVNTVGILVGAGVIVMLGVAFVPGLIMIFMILAAVYDAWAVYRSKHMLELADTMIGLQLPILLVAPQDKGYSFKDEKTRMVDKVEVPQQMPQMSSNKVIKKKNSEALFMGLGDIIFPGMLVLSAVQWLDSDNSFAIAMFALAGSLLGYLALMTYVARGKAQAGLPLLNGGAIVGYLIGGLIFMGSEIFNLGISL